MSCLLSHLQGQSSAWLICRFADPSSILLGSTRTPPSASEERTGKPSVLMTQRTLVRSRQNRKVPHSTFLPTARSSLLARDSRDLREKRDGQDGRELRVALFPPVPPVSPESGIGDCSRSVHESCGLSLGGTEPSLVASYRSHEPWRNPSYSFGLSCLFG